MNKTGQKLRFMGSLIVLIGIILGIATATVMCLVMNKLFIGIIVGISTAITIIAFGLVLEGIGEIIYLLDK